MVAMRRLTGSPYAAMRNSSCMQATLSGYTARWHTRWHTRCISLLILFGLCLSPAFMEESCIQIDA
jgi:hypothetical protein